MALGLAGKPDILGRAKKANEFIKHGADFAEIEIELSDGTGNEAKNLIVKRQINAANSNWYLNGSKVQTEQKVREAIQSLGVQIDNLCQLLPQDKVSEFSRMNPEQVLRETERAVDESLLELHDKLVESKKDLTIIRRDFGHKQGQLNQLEEQQERDGSRIRQHELKAKLEQRLKLIEQKMPWQEFELIRQSALAMKQEIEVLKKKGDELNVIMEPLKQKADECVKHFEALKPKYEMAKKQKKTTDKAVRKRNDDVSEKEDDVSVLLDDRKKIFDTEKKRKEKIARIRADLAKMKEEARKLAPIDRMEEEWKGKEAEYRRLSNIRIEGNQRVQQSKTELSQVDRDLAMKTDALKRARDAKMQRARKLDDLNHDRNNTMEHTLNRINQGGFVGEVYLFGVELDINAPQDSAKRPTAQVVEDALPNYLFSAVICADPRDRNTIMTWSNQANLKLSVILAPSLADPIVPRPINAATQTQVRVTHWLDQLIKAPPLIMHFLKVKQHVHTIACGGPDMDDEKVEKAFFANNKNAPCHMYQSGVPQGVMKYYSRKSRYGDHTSNQSQPVGDPRLLTFEVTHEVSELQNQIDQLKDSQANLRMQLRRCEAEYQEVCQKMTATEKFKKQFFELKKKHADCNGKVSTLEQKLKDEERKDERGAQEELKANDKGMEKAKIALQHSLSLLTKSLVDSNERLIVYHAYSISMQASKDRLKKLNDVRKAKSEEVTRYNASFKEKTVQYKEEKHKAKLKSEEALEKSGGALTDEIRAQFDQLPGDIDELKKEKESLTAQIKMAISVNPNMVEEWKKRAKSIERLSKDVKKDGAVVEKKEKELAALREKWVPRIKAIADTVNAKFTKYFSEIGCDGEAAFVENEDDYDKCCLQLRVRFRKDDPTLTVLDAHVHSGGERSVTTMLYLLSLQGITSLPFRLVDEVNQGMDPSNERMIFKQVVNASSSAPGLPQYWLVTPKLLPDLKYNEDTKILCVFNGPWMVGDHEFDNKKFLQAAKRLKKSKK